LGLALWSWMARRPAVYAMVTALGVRVLSLLGGAEKLIHYLPLGGGWTAGRDLPAPEGRTFRELYARKDRRS
jgi:L-lactate dehydrogenase complex protein LldF